MPHRYLIGSSNIPWQPSRHTGQEHQDRGVQDVPIPRRGHQRHESRDVREPEYYPEQLGIWYDYGRKEPFQLGSNSFSDLRGRADLVFRTTFCLLTATSLGGHTAISAS